MSESKHIPFHTILASLPDEPPAPAERSTTYVSMWTDGDLIYTKANPGPKEMSKAEKEDYQLAVANHIADALELITGVEMTTGYFEPEGKDPFACASACSGGCYIDTNG